MSMTRKTSDGQSVVVTAPSGGVEANRFYLISGFFGWVFQDADAGEDCVLDQTLCEYETDEALSTDVISLGDAIYWDDSAKNFTTTVGSNTLVGKATSAKASGSTVMTIKRTAL